LSAKRKAKGQLTPPRPPDHGRPLGCWCSVQAVRERLENTMGFAYTTAQTMLNVLHRIAARPPNPPRASLRTRAAPDA
jgi:hypothetical protein